jgi:eukaryotic-like serine/threonine-protein kinase
MLRNPGQIVGHFKIVEFLGKHGPGAVYKAQDLVLDRFVVIKFLPLEFCSNNDAWQDFVREARAVSVLEHPNIGTTIDISRTEKGEPFFVWPWREGESLRRVMARERLGIVRALEIAICAAEGLARAHEAGVIHLGLTPSSITLVKGDTVRIIDFGLTRLAARSGWNDAESSGETAMYRSPEQLKGEPADARSDTWSLGVVLFEMIAGRHPFESDNGRGSLPVAVRGAPALLRTLRPDVPAAIAQVVEKALSRDRKDRYPTAREFLSDLKLARDADHGVRTSAEVETAQRTRNRRYIRGSLIAGGSLLLLLAVLYAIPPIGREEQFATHPKTILITSFQNLTGIDSLNYFQFALQHQLITSLEQSVYFRPTSWARLGDLKKQAGRPDSGLIDEALGLELSKLDKAEALLAASFSRTGNRFTITTRLVDVATQQTLMTPVSSGRGIESFFDQVDQLSHKISTGLGVSATLTQETIRPIEEISTRSQLAYQLTLTGWELVRSGKRLEALQNFELAVKEDSLFVSPWIGLRTVYLDLGYLTKGRHAAEKAISLFAKGSERDKLMIAMIDTSLRTVVMGRPGATYLDFLRYRVLRFPKDKSYLYALGLELQTTHGRVDEAIEVFQQILDLDPQYGFAMSTLALAYAQKQEYDRAIGVLNRYAAISPTNSFAYHTRGDVYVMADRYDDAVASYTRASAIEPTFIEHKMKISRVCYWREQYDDALRWNDSAMVYAPSPGKKADLLWNRAYWSYWLGRLGDAEVSLRAREVLLNSIGNMGSGYFNAWIALERGKFGEARASLASWIANYRRSVGEALLAPRMDIQYLLCLGFVDLREGKLDSADLRLNTIERIRAAFPGSDTSFVTRQTVRAAEQARRLLQGELLLARKRPAEVPGLYPSGMSDMHWDPLLSVNGPGWRGIWRSYADIPVETDGLARAYETLGQLDPAIALYETGMALGGRTWGVSPRHHYRLAKLYEQKKLYKLAILEYERFLKIWGKADPIYPEPKDARARLARLKGM